MITAYYEVLDRKTGEVVYSDFDWFSSEEAAVKHFEEKYARHQVLVARITEFAK